MADAGHSGKPLPVKLGLKPGMRARLVGIPGGAFCPTTVAVPRRFATLTPRVAIVGALGIAVRDRR
jgi:hypothetical protein